MFSTSFFRELLHLSFPHIINPFDFLNLFRAAELQIAGESLWNESVVTFPSVYFLNPTAAVICYLQNQQTLALSADFCVLQLVAGFW